MDDEDGAQAVQSVYCNGQWTAYGWKECASSPGSYAPGAVPSGSDDATPWSNSVDEADGSQDSSASAAEQPKTPPWQEPPPAKRLAASPVGCTAGGKRLVESNFDHCPTPQSYVHCGPHHRSELRDTISREDVQRLHEIWWYYRDDLTWPWYDKKPQFWDNDFRDFRAIAQKVVDAMSEEYGEPMVLDQATISNTNHIGHPPHADNVQFDSVWWKGKRIRTEDEVVAAQEGAYVLWRTEKTSYRSYSCSTSLTESDEYEGGEVQFFDHWGDKDPSSSSKPDICCSTAFCGCSKNIHAVVGVRSGFRLQLLIWTRPPYAVVADSQQHVCYFRPGTGKGVWLTTADIQSWERKEAEKEGRTFAPTWEDYAEKDDGCQCEKCMAERGRLAWKDAKPARGGDEAASTPTTSAGNSAAGSSADENSGDEERAVVAPAPEVTHRALHCPHPQAQTHCRLHHRAELHQTLTKGDISQLHLLWETHNDDLSYPWYDEKPDFTEKEFTKFREIAEKVVAAMAQEYQQPMVLDQATVSSTNHLGHPPHADNVQFDSVWWRGRQIKQRDELAAARGGAEVFWKAAKTVHRCHSAMIALTPPDECSGGELEFYDNWGDTDPSQKYTCEPGSGVSYCGCQKSIHAVTGVKWGWRLVLLVWTRSPEVPVPDDQKHVCYFRPGTGRSVWLTASDLEQTSRRTSAKVKDHSRKCSSSVWQA